MVAISPWQVTVLQAIGIPEDAWYEVEMLEKGELSPGPGDGYTKQAGNYYNIYIYIRLYTYMNIYICSMEIFGNYTFASSK